MGLNWPGLETYETLFLEHMIKPDRNIPRFRGFALSFLFPLFYPPWKGARRDHHDGPFPFYFFSFPPPLQGGDLEKGM